MPKGQEQVQATIALCQALAEGVRALPVAEDAWKAEIVGRLERVGQTLAGLEGRFFLRSKLCLPFAARCLREAEGLQEILQQLQSAPQDSTRQRLGKALMLLEGAVQALDERSLMQGMAIT